MYAPALPKSTLAQSTKHPIAGVFTTGILGYLALAVILCFWKFILLEHPERNTVLSFAQFLPELGNITAYLTKILCFGILPNVLLWALSLNLRRDNADQAMTLLSLAAAQNATLVLDITAPSLPISQTAVLHLAHLFSLYPEHLTPHAVLTHGLYGVIWTLTALTLWSTRKVGPLHFHSEVFQFLNLAHLATAAVIVTSFVNSIAMAPLVLETVLSPQFLWAQYFASTSAGIFLLTGLFYHLGLTHQIQGDFTQFAHSHWFTLVLLLLITGVFLSPQNLEQDEVLWVSCVLLLALWLTQSFYFYFATKMLFESVKLNRLIEISLVFAVALVCLTLAACMVKHLFESITNTPFFWSFLEESQGVALVILTANLLWLFQIRLTPRNRQEQAQEKVQESTHEK